MRILITYAGRRVTTKDTLMFKYYKEDGSTLTFSKKILSIPVGAIIEVTETETGVKSPYDYKGRTQQNIDEWLEADNAAQLAVEQTKMMQKKQTGRYEDAISKLQDAYIALPHPQRLAFLVRVQRDIQKINK